MQSLSFLYKDSFLLLTREVGGRRVSRKALKVQTLGYKDDRTP